MLSLCGNSLCGVKVSRADFELYNNGEETLGPRMLERVLYPRNSSYNKGDYCKLSRLSYMQLVQNRSSGKLSGCD